jgi:hypothetical protein
MKPKALAWLGNNFGGFSALMVILNKSEAEALQELLNGERLWSWPNGRIQLGQTFPDLAVINNLVRQGLLDQAYEPTEAGRSALQSWQSSIGLPANKIIRTPNSDPRPLPSGD